jgi:excisionase family DNA binding protein
MQTATSASPHVQTDSDPWLTLREGAEHVKANEATLRREIRRGRLRHARIGGRKCIRVRRSWLDEWLEQTSTPAEVSQ